MKITIQGGEFRACSSAYVKTRIGGERYKFKLGILCKRPCEHVYFHVLWVSRSFTLSAQLLLKYLKVILLEYDKAKKNPHCVQKVSHKIPSNDFCREAATFRLCREACFRYTREQIFVCLCVCLSVCLSTQMKVKGFPLFLSTQKISFAIISKKME